MKLTLVAASMLLLSCNLLKDRSADAGSAGSTTTTTAVAPPATTATTSAEPSGPFKVEIAGSAKDRVAFSNWKPVMMSATFRLKLLKGPALKSVKCTLYKADDVKVNTLLVQVPPLSEGEAGDGECAGNLQASEIARVKMEVE